MGPPLCSAGYLARVPTSKSLTTFSESLPEPVFDIVLRNRNSVRSTSRSCALQSATKYALSPSLPGSRVKKLEIMNLGAHG